MLRCQGYRGRTLPWPGEPLLVWCSTGHKVQGLLLVQVDLERVDIVASSKDSDLEAFSRNPTHGSFAALAFQLTAKTNYVNERFLSY